MNNTFNSAPTAAINENNLEKKISALEKIRCSADTRSAMIVVALGKKPSATIDLLQGDEDLESIKQKMTEAGLFFENIDEPPFPTEVRFGDMTIQKSPDAVQVASLVITTSRVEATRVANLFKSERTEGMTFEIGKSLGYPPTSTEAYIGKRERYERGLDPFVERRIPGTLQFMLSKEHWKEEIKTSIDWLQSIKEKSPELYQQIIDTQSSEYEGVPLID